MIREPDAGDSTDLMAKQLKSLNQAKLDTTATHQKFIPFNPQDQSSKLSKK